MSLVFLKYGADMLKEITKHVQKDNCPDCIQLAYKIYMELEKEEPIPQEKVERFNKMIQKIENEFKPKKIAMYKEFLKTCDEKEKEGFKIHGKLFRKHPLYVKIQIRRKELQEDLEELSD